jgi:hypothetical protein
MQKNDLVYRNTGRATGTVRRQYERWRKSQGIPERCDEPGCVFHTQPMIWNGKLIKPIMDHSNGNNSDNRPDNLRFLCPNCDSQLQTRGGGNRGRIEKSDGGFAIVSKDGQRDYILPAEAGTFTISGQGLKNSGEE